MRDSARTRLAAVALAALSVTAAVAQDAGAGEPQAAEARDAPDTPIRLQPVQQPAAQAATEIESYLPSPDELERVQIETRLLECIGRLGDQSWAVREAATAELLSGNFIREQIYAALARLKLSCEQRHRLLTAVHDNLLSTPRGAVGIRVDQRFMPENKIVVEELLPDLPARQVLHVGDRITHLHGKPLVDWNSFVKEVQSRKPGSKIKVTVERVVSGRRPHRLQIAEEEPKYKTIEVEIELGSAEMLRDATGQVQRGGEVYRRLQDEADEVVVTFSPQPKQIRLEG